MLPRQVAFRSSAGANVPPLDLLLCSHAAASFFNWHGHLPLFLLVLNVSCWCCCGATWPSAPVYSDSWEEREEEGESSFCWGWGFKPERLLRRTPYLSWLFVTVNYVALLLQTAALKGSKSFNADRCCAIFCSRRPEGCISYTLTPATSFSFPQ